MPSWASTLAGAGTFAVLSGLEDRFPLRRRVAAPLRRRLRNLATAALSLAVAVPLQALVLSP